MGETRPENKRGIISHSDLKPDTKLYRYMSLKQFMTFIETETMYLTKVINWEDTWELPIKKLPTLNDNGELEYPIWSNSEIMYGMCWSQTRESDAMWRIYSPHKDGILIETSVKKFDLFKEIQYGYLAPVIYYENLQDGYSELALKKYRGLFKDAYLKRDAFKHESEVRLVTLNEEKCLEPLQNNGNVINLKVNPREFIESITIDPRADDWYIGMIEKYCDRLNLFKPSKSTLYSNVHDFTKLAIQYIPVTE